MNSKVTPINGEPTRTEMMNKFLRRSWNYSSDCIERLMPGSIDELLDLVREHLGTWRGAKVELHIHDPFLRSQGFSSRVGLLFAIETVEVIRTDRRTIAFTGPVLDGASNRTVTLIMDDVGATRVILDEVVATK